MLTQEENEIQDNIKVITENRNQFKTTGYKGYAHGTTSRYRKETNDFLTAQRSPGKVTGIEHHTTTTSQGDMEMYIITVSSPKDRDLILGHGSGSIRLTFSEETARGNSLKYGRKGMLQVGQLNKGGNRLPFRTNGSTTGMSTNPKYMKSWAEAANEMKDQGRNEILDGFWPQIDCQDVISRHSPAKKKSDTKNAWGEEIEVEEEETWKVKTPVKTGTDQERRFATIEKAQAEQSTLVTTLTDALVPTHSAGPGWNATKYSPKPTLPSKTQTEQSTHS
jgi:hypothetical protein